MHNLIIQRFLGQPNIIWVQMCHHTKSRETRPQRKSLHMNSPSHCTWTWHKTSWTWSSLSLQFLTDSRLEITVQCSGSEMFLLLDPVGLGAGSFLLGLLLEASEPAPVSFTPSPSRCSVPCVSCRVWRADRGAAQMGFSCVRRWWQMPAEAQQRDVLLVSGQTLHTEAPTSCNPPFLSFCLSSVLTFSASLTLFYVSPFPALCSLKPPSPCFPLLSFMHW